MKQLLLIRHAKSSWDDENIEDRDRPLNKRGKKEASILGSFLKEKNFRPQLIISSPAKRAVKTTKKIIKKIKHSELNIDFNEVIYSGNVASMVACIRSLDKKNEQVFMIGHNPNLLDLANFLTGSSIEKLPTSGFILINFEVKSWQYISGKSGIIVQAGKARN